MFWIFELPDRLLHERAELDALAGEVTWIQAKRWGLDDELRVKVEVDIVINDVIYEVELIYPRLFPDTPAIIRPRSSTTTVRWSDHQYGPGGSLCLEWGPDNWRAEITGAMLLRSAHRLVAAEAAAGPTPASLPSRHYTTFGQAMRANSCRLVVTNRLRDYLHQLPIGSHRSLVTHNLFHGVADVFFISAVKPPEGEPVVLSDVPSGVKSSFPIFAPKGTGWVFKSAQFAGSEEVRSLDTLLTVVCRAGFEDFTLPDTEGESGTKAEYLFLLQGADNQARAYWYYSLNGGTFKECAIVGMAPSEGQRTPPEHLGLSEKQIGIVGLGSVGSKVAVSLARSGVRKFVLIDDDLLLPENMCRHELDWASVGVHKADAVKEAIVIVAPEVDVKVLLTRIGGQESARYASTALDALATCNVVIDATANSTVFVQLASICQRRKRTLVWGELFAGGIGGLLIRSRPGKDPDPLTMRAGVHAYLDTQEPAPVALAATRYDVESEDTPPLIASDAEVSQFASMVTRFALDAALERNPSEFPDSAYLMGFKRAWIFTAPFDTRPISVAHPPADEADLAEKQSASRQEAIEFLCQLVTERTDAQADPAQ
jgi:hypothetical protein